MAIYEEMRDGSRLLHSTISQREVYDVQVFLDCTHCVVFLQGTTDNVSSNHINLFYLVLYS